MLFSDDDDDDELMDAAYQPDQDEDEEVDVVPRRRPSRRSSHASYPNPSTDNTQAHSTVSVWSITCIAVPFTPH
jgi:hypothetical protein